MAASAVTALGLAQEIQDMEINIVTVDAQNDSLQALSQGKLCALAAQSGYDIGYETIEYIDSMRKGESDGKDRLLDAPIFTQDNVE